MVQQHCAGLETTFVGGRPSGRGVLALEKNSELRATYNAILKQHEMGVIASGKPIQVFQKLIAAFRQRLMAVHCSELARSCKRDPVVAYGAVRRFGRWRFDADGPVSLIRTRRKPQEVLVSVIEVTHHLVRSGHLEVPA